MYNDVEKNSGSRLDKIENTLLEFKSGKLKLSGYFTSPTSSAKYPTVLLLEGSESHPRKMKARIVLSEK